jgi:hypothetical protein
MTSREGRTLEELLVQQADAQGDAPFLCAVAALSIIEASLNETGRCCQRNSR